MTMLLRVFVPCLLLATAHLGAETVNSSPFPSGAGVDVLQVMFGQQPTEQGLSFDRSVPHYAAIAVNGKDTDAWVTEKGTPPGPGWLKSFRFHVTDPHFQKGGRPVVEFEVTAYVPKPGTISMQADTAEGNKRILDVWHQGKAWEIYRIPIDNAFFGARPDAAGEKFPLAGFDFSISSSGAALYLQSVRLAGYDTEHDVVWSKCLKVEGISTDGPGGILIWPKAPKQKLSITVQNFARVPAHFHYRLQITGYDDKAVLVQDGKLDLNGGASSPLAWPVDTSTWPLGPYDGTFSVFDDTRPGEVARGE